MTTTTEFSVTISRNSIGGQWYIEGLDMPETNIRVPYRHVDNYAVESGFEKDEVERLKGGETITIGGYSAIALCELSEAYEG